MKTSVGIGSDSPAALGACLCFSLVGCDVALHPFEDLDAHMICNAESGPRCETVGNDAGLDSSDHRPCTTSADCIGTDVCKSHLCVPSDAGTGKDIGATDAGCVEQLVVTPTEVDFGVVTKGCNSKNLPVNLGNNGCLQQDIYSIDIAPLGSGMVFETTSVTPFPLRPAETVGISLRFRATANSGGKSASLHIQTSLGDVEVQLRGTATLSTAALDVFTQAAPPDTSFHLSRWPLETTIHVTVNTKVVAEGGATGWSYDEADNDVVFGANAVPPEGAEIEVTYEAECF